MSAAGVRGAVQVREAQPHDLPGLANLAAASPLVQRYALDASSALEYLRAGREAGDTLLLAQDADGAVVGLAWVLRLRGFGAAAYLRLLLVAEERQSQGVGDLLLAAAEERAAAWARHLLLLASHDNLGAHRFYERRGYRRIGQLAELVLPGVDEVLFQKRLDQEERA